MFYGAALGVGYVLLCYVLARAYVHPSRNVPAKPPAFADLEIPGRKQPIVAWSAGDLSASPAIFLFAHGYGGNRSDWIGLMGELETKGYASVALAMPGQDASKEPEVGFGRTEAETVADAARWLRQRYPESKIVAVGLSLGGAAVWLASAEAPEAMDAVATEGAFATFDEASRAWFDALAPGGSVAFRPVIWFGTAMTGVRVQDVRPIDAAAHWKGRPALVIHAEHDTLIGRSHADRLAAASGAELWIIPDATHAQGGSMALNEYADRLVKLANP